MKTRLPWPKKKATTLQPSLSSLLFYMSIVDCYSYSYKQDNSISLMVLESYPILYQFYEYLFEGYIHYNTYEYELMKIYDKKWIILDHIYQLSLFDSVCFHDILFIRSLLLSLLWMHLKTIVNYCTHFQIRYSKILQSC